MTLEYLCKKYGMKINCTGTHYIAFIIDNCLLMDFCNITKVYEMAAKQFGTTSKKVERAIRYTKETAGFGKTKNSEFLFEVKNNYKK